MSDYTYWQNGLAITGGKRPLTRDEQKSLGLIDEASSGFFKKRVSRGGAYVPVALWRQDDAMVALVDGKPSPADLVWSFACPFPITEQAYRKRIETGMWDDEDPAVAASLEPPAAAIGDNNPPQDEAEILKGQIEAATANADAYKDIKDDETAAKAQGVRSRLLELSGEVEDKHKVEKAPHLAAGRAVDARWFPLRDKAKDAANAIRAALSAYETRKDAVRRAAEAKAAEDARKAAEAGKPVPAPQPAPEVPPERAQVRSSYGRAATVKTVRVAKVIDYDALFGSIKTHPELVALMDKLAQRAVDAGVDVKGVEITEEKKVV